MRLSQVQLQSVIPTRNLLVECERVRTVGSRQTPQDVGARLFHQVANGESPLIWLQRDCAGTGLSLDWPSPDNPASPKRMRAWRQGVPKNVGQSGIARWNRPPVPPHHLPNTPPARARHARISHALSDHYLTAFSAGGSSRRWAVKTKIRPKTSKPPPRTPGTIVVLCSTVLVDISLGLSGGLELEAIIT